MNTTKIPVAVFKLGRIVKTLTAQDLLSQQDILLAIQRHQAGDWGEINAADSAANDQAIVNGSRVVSSYRSSEGLKFLLITEADRSVTTILLPEDA